MKDAETKVVTSCDDLRRLKFSPVSPRAFTEHGALPVAGDKRGRGWEDS